MEQKKDNKKLLASLIPVVVIALIGIIAMFVLSKEDGYRLIQVYEVNGEAMIDRPAIGSMDAYENLNLISGDKVTTMLKSYTRLKLDEDKYLLAEEDSIIELVATGDAKNAKTSINLLQGAVTIEVQNKLNSNSTFEVTTPNSVMAVRGTVFRVKVDVDENGKPITKVTVFEGAVEVQKKDENGNLTQEQMIESSMESLIYNENGEEVLVILEEIDVSDLPLEVLNVLEEIIEGGRELSISLEDIEEAIEVIKQEQSIEEGSESEDENGSEEEEEQENIEDEQSGNADDEQQGNIEDEQSGNADDEQQGSSEEEQPGSTDDEQQGDEENEIGEEKRVFTVTFTYNGMVFGTQQVLEGELVSEPKLIPAPSGHWEFDFSTPITEDTEIKFVE